MRYPNSRRTELVFELEVLRAIALCPFEARQSRKVVDFIGRIITVRFAKDIYESIEGIKDCVNFTDTAADAHQLIEKLQAEPNRYVVEAQKHWKAGVDCYVHNPRIIWNAALTFWLESVSYGCTISSARHTVTAMLHAYNAARTKKWLREIQILERLCDHLDMAVLR